LLGAPDSQRGLLVDIQKEELVPGQTIPASQNDDFFADLRHVEPLLSTTQATYIILRRHDPSNADAFVVVTFVPDTAPVRQKMLFASTRLTLVRELGVERFRETLFATDPKELTVEGWKAHEASGASAAPLTEEEQGQKTLKEAEDEEGARIGTAGRKSHVLGMGMSHESGVVEALAAFGTGTGNNLVQLKLDVAKETIQLVGTSSIEPAQLASAISGSEPRYAFYRFEHQFQGQQQSPVVFLYSCPTESKVKERMVYASSRNFVSEKLAEEHGVKVEKRLEASSPSDFTEKLLHEEFHPQTEAKSAFARPKRPGRR